MSSPTTPAITDVPHWLLMEQVTPECAKPPRVLDELTTKIYEIAFESSVLPLLATGRTLDSILKEYHAPIEVHKFRTWIYRDPERKRRYDQVMEIGSEAIEEEILRISDAMENPLEDVQRSTLRIATRKWIMGVRNRKRYGDVKQLDVNNTTTVNIRNLLEEREQQLMNVYDGEATVVEDGQ